MGLCMELTVCFAVCCRCPTPIFNNRTITTRTHTRKPFLYFYIYVYYTFFLVLIPKAGPTNKER